MQILLTFAYSLVFFFLIGKMKFFRLPGISVKLLKAGFIVKLFAGIAVGLIYTYYYTDRLTADTFKFFDDSKVLFDALHDHPSHYWKMLTGIGASSPDLQPYYNTMNNWYDTYSPFNDNRTMIRLNAFIRLFSMGYYYVHVVVVCFLSFIGIVAITKVFSREFATLTLEIFLVFLLLPSVLFWGSGLLKDALVFFTFGLSILFFDKLLNDGRYKTEHLLVFIISMLLLMLTKFQVFLVSLPLFTAWLIAGKTKYNALLVFTLCSCVFGLAVVLVSLFIPGCDMILLMVDKQQSFFELAQKTAAGSIISIPVLKPELSNFLINMPRGFLTSLIRPFLTDTGALLNTISAVENTLILLFGFYCVINFKKVNFKNKILPAFCLFYTLYSFTLIGMITPVLGAIVRYKAQALPFLVVLFIIGSHPSVKKLTDRFKPVSTI